MQTNSASINHEASFNHTYNQSPENQSTQSADSFTLDQSSYQSLISSLDKLSPFEAIRYAQEINRMNGFEVVSWVEVGRWKRYLKKQNYIYDVNNSEQLDEKFRPTPHHNVKKEIENTQKEILDIEISKIKRQQLQRGYMLLLNT